MTLNGLMSKPPLISVMFADKQFNYRKVLRENSSVRWLFVINDPCLVVSYTFHPLLMKV